MPPSVPDVTLIPHLTVLLHITPFSGPQRRICLLKFSPPARIFLRSEETCRQTSILFRRTELSELLHLHLAHANAFCAARSKVTASKRLTASLPALRRGTYKASSTSAADCLKAIRHGWTAVDGEPPNFTLAVRISSPTNAPDGKQADFQ